VGDHGAKNILTILFERRRGASGRRELTSAYRRDDPDRWIEREANQGTI
jgi:hypothetical protein